MAMSDVDAKPTSGAEAEPWNRTDWTEESIKAWNGGVIEEFRANGGKAGGPYAGGDLLLLTTTGARSGRRHTVPLSYLAEGERLIVSSLLGAAYPAWYHNLMANPDVTVELGAETFDATATVAAGKERERLWAWVTERWPLLADHQATTPLQIPLVGLRRSTVDAH
jgi:deazaflavin-dependent oxidoreductase (nitroreductase family)